MWYDVWQGNIITVLFLPSFLPSFLPLHVLILILLSSSCLSPFHFSTTLACYPFISFSFPSILPPSIPSFIHSLSPFPSFCSTFLFLCHLLASTHPPLTLSLLPSFIIFFLHQFFLLHLVLPHFLPRFSLPPFLSSYLPSFIHPFLLSALISFFPF